MKLTNKKILLIVIFVGSILRLYNFHQIPFTHDEFSALFRTNFDSFTDLIDKGVVIDGHPAGVQVFLYYWVKIFGIEEWMVKLPFVLFGIISIYLIFLIAKNWFNETVALIASAFMASLQFPIIYSQIARPYISGLFFALAMIYFWTKMIKNPSENFFRNSIFYIIFASLCTYNHHFSLLFVAIVGIIGLFFINTKYLLKYMISGSLVVLLYIPHLQIFIYQLNVGGIEGWLGKPDNYFILDFIYYIFNFSNFVILLVLGIIVLGFLKNEIRDFNYKNYILFSILFFLPFLIGFFYSKYVNAVLQFSVLIFSFPFLFFILFGHIKNQKTLVNLIIISIILSINILTLIFERQHYKLFYNSPYKQIITDGNDLKKDSNTIFIIDSHKKISSYYFSKLNIDSNFLWLSDFENEVSLINYLNSNSVKKSNLYFGALSSVNPVIIPILQEYYPNLKWQKNYVGGTTYLFSNENVNHKDTISFLNFEWVNTNNWSNINNQNIIDTIFYSSNHCYYIDKNIEWGPTFTTPFEIITINKKDFIDISLKAKKNDSINELLLVSQLESNGNIIDWRSSSFDKYYNKYDSLHKWFNVYHSIKLSDINLRHRDIQLKVFIWNKGKNSVYIDDVSINIRKGNDIIYSN